MERKKRVASQDGSLFLSALQESEDKFYKMADSAQLAIMIYQNNRWIYANRAAVDISGFSVDELKKMDLCEIVPIQFRDFATEMSRRRLAGEMDSVTYEIKIRTKNLDEKWVSVTGSRIDYKSQPAAVVSIADVSAIKDYENRVALLSEGIDRSPVSVLITNKDGDIEYANRYFLEISGYCLDGLKEKRIRILKPEHHFSQGEYIEIIDKIERGEVWTGEYMNKRKDGSHFWEYVNISPIVSEEGELSNIIVIGQDITKHKEFEEELKRAKLKAEESERLKSSFLRNVSHEIRTPLNAIMGFTNLISEICDMNEDIKLYSSIVAENCKELEIMLSDIISFSSVESGEVPLDISRIDLSTLVAELDDKFQPEAIKKGLIFSCNYGYQEGVAAGNIVINADREKVNIVLSKLLHNAIKFTDRGSVLLYYTVKDSMVNFYVKDSGPGIPKDKVNTLFEKFNKVHEGYLYSREGLGLGLAISKAYAKLMGGDVAIERNGGDGVIFRFSLPLN